MMSEKIREFPNKWNNFTVFWNDGAYYSTHREHTLMLKKQSGFILLSLLPPLCLVSLWIFHLLSTHLLHLKLMAAFDEEMTAFTQAEKALSQGETAILPPQENGHGKINLHTEYTFYLHKTPQCGIFYTVNAFSRVGGSHIHLQSVVHFPHTGNTPCPPDHTHALRHRIVWREVH